MTPGARFYAQIEDWCDLCEQAMDAVLRESTQRTIDGIKIGPSITRSGHREYGTIPRDLATLAGSLQTTLTGSSFGTFSGEANYSFGVAQMSAGDAIYFTWGGAASEYALAVHYGANGVPGTMWVDVAANGWLGTVKDVVAEVKQRLKN